MDASKLIKRYCLALLPEDLDGRLDQELLQTYHSLKKNLDWSLSLEELVFLMGKGSCNEVYKYNGLYLKLGQIKKDFEERKGQIIELRETMEPLSESKTLFGCCARISFHYESRQIVSVLRSEEGYWLRHKKNSEVNYELLNGEVRAFSYPYPPAPFQRRIVFAEELLEENVGKGSIEKEMIQDNLKQLIFLKYLYWDMKEFSNHLSPQERLGVSLHFYKYNPCEFWRPHQAVIITNQKILLDGEVTPFSLLKEGIPWATEDNLLMEREEGNELREVKTFTFPRFRDIYSAKLKIFSAEESEIKGIINGLE